MCFSDHRLNLTEEGFSRNETRCRQDASLTEIGWSGSSVHLKKLTPPHLVHGNKIEAGRFRTKKKYQSSLFHSWWFLQNNTLWAKKKKLQYNLQRSHYNLPIIFPPFRFDLWTIYLVSLPAKWMSPQRTEIISSTLWTSRNMELLENGTAPYRRYLILFGGEFCLFANQNSVRHGQVHYCEAPQKCIQKHIFSPFFAFFANGN